jgi:hypothetical protein
MKNLNYKFLFFLGLLPACITVTTGGLISAGFLSAPPGAILATILVTWSVVLGMIICR